MTRLAIISTHPIQYYAPWFRWITENTGLELRVFYLWDFGIKDTHDREFGQKLEWDIPLLGGYDHEFVPNVSPRPTTASFRGLRNPELARRVARWRPDAVLLMTYNNEAVFRFLAHWQLMGRPAPLLFRGDSHRLEPRAGLKESFRRFAIARVFGRFDAVLSVGKANHDYFRLHGVPEHRIFFSPHSVENERFRAAADEAREEARAWRRSLGIGDDRRVVLFVGKLVPRKRPLDLLEAFRRANVPRSTLLYVGTGELEEELRRRAGDLPVAFGGFQNQSQMPKVYAAGEVLALPSFFETWGLVLNEAMCAGLPVVASSYVGAAHDLVHPGRNGYRHACGDVEGLAVGLRRLLRSTARRRAFGEASRRIIDGYSYRTATRGLAMALRYLGCGDVELRA